MATLPPGDSSAWPKICACGATLTRELWKTLRLVGRISDHAGGQLELRNCAVCGSTLAMAIADPPDDPPAG